MDFGAREVGAVDLGGNRGLIARTTDMPMGIDFLPDGRLLLVSVYEGKLLVWEPGGSLTSYADLSSLSGKPGVNCSWTAGAKPTSATSASTSQAASSLPGSVGLVTPGGTVRQVPAGLAFPNGMAMVPDNGTLVVAESYGER